MSSLLLDRGLRGNEKQRHHLVPPADLTAAGRIIWNQTRRPTPTCNLLGELAGLGSRDRER